VILCALLLTLPPLYVLSYGPACYLDDKLSARQTQGNRI